ncbi:MAG: MerR family DNA-binding transcriptional regulator [Paracoccaceae bacterium]|nr:MAG: MerR family DNA-binding transcriptional regulator [Paracoccaceae bacterium]
MARHYSTGEVARKLNVSVRTLRYYDQINLVTPRIRTMYRNDFIVMTKCFGFKKSCF